MSDIEKRARDILLSHYRAAGYCDGDPLAASDANAVAIKAIIAALAPPEGYVLVPVEPTEAMLDQAANIEVGYPTWAGGRDCVTYTETKAIWAAMLAALPEVTK